MGLKPRPSRIHLDWDAISQDGYAFQAMARELFSLKYEERFSPGPVHRGPDGGWDAMLQGPFSGTSGTWKVACAAYKNRDDLRRKLRRENKNARRTGADALLILTSLDLTNPECCELEKLAGEGLRNTRVYARGNLDKMVRRQRWVRATYFGIPFIAGFAPLGNKDHVIGPDIELAGRADQVQRFAEFLRGDEELLIISGPGGVGKSRLLRELPSIAAAIRPWSRRPSVWLRNPGIRTISSALVELPPDRRRLVLCIDDAHLALDDLAELIQLAGQDNGAMTIKGIVACRAADRRRVEELCDQRGCAFTPIELPALDEGATRQIIHEDLGESAPGRDARLLAESRGNLFLLRAGAREEVDEEFERKLANKFIDEARSLVSEPNDLLVELVRAAMWAPIAESRVAAAPALSALAEGGLLRLVGARYRVRTDVEGDFVLRNLSQEPKCRAEISRLLLAASAQSDHAWVVERDTIIRNLAAAGGEDTRRLFRNVSARWLERASVSTLTERRRHVRIAPYVAPFAPQAIFELVRHYLVITDQADGFSAADVAPVIEAIGLELDAAAALDLAECAHDGSPDWDHKAREIVEFLLNPGIVRDPDFHEALLWVDKKLENGESRVTPLIDAIIAASLAKTFSWSTTEGRSFIESEAPFPAVPEVFEVRDAALALVERLLVHDNPDYRRVGAERFAALGRDGWRVSTAALEPRVDAERKRLLPLVAERLRAERDVRIANVLYNDLLARWAAQDDDSEDIMGDILRQTRRSLDLRAYQLSENPWEWFSDIAELLAEAPSKDRWTWWIERETSGRWPWTEDSLASLVAELRATHLSPSDLVSLTELVIATRRPEILLNLWCFQDEELFDAAIEATGDRLEVHALLTEVRERVALTNTPTAAHERLAVVLEQDDDRALRRFAGNLHRVSAQDRLRIAGRLIEEKAIARRVLALELIVGDRRLARHDVLAMLARGLRDGDWSEGWQILWRCFQAEVQLEDLRELPKLVEILMERVAEAVASGWRGPNDWYYARELVAHLERARPGARLEIAGNALSTATVYDIPWLISASLETAGGLRALAASCRRWLAEGKLRGARDVATLLQFGLGKLSSSLEQTEPDNGAYELAEHLLEGDQLDQEVGLALLSELRLDSRACRKIASLVASAGPLRNTARSLLPRFTGPRGVYIGGDDGEPPKAFVDIKKMLDLAEEGATAPARAVLADLRRRVDQWITFNLEIQEADASARW